MATYTSYLNLEKPATSETFNLSKINSNWDKIDTGVSNVNARFNGINFKNVSLTANTAKTITVEENTRIFLFFSSSYISCIGMAHIAYYGGSTKKADSPVWFKEASGVTVNTATNGQFTVTTEYNALMWIVVLNGGVNV